MRAMQILRLISSCELQPTAGETDRRASFVPVESRGLTCVTGEPLVRQIGSQSSPVKHADSVSHGSLPRHFS